jgi:hypothetical protein
MEKGNTIEYYTHLHLSLWPLVILYYPVSIAIKTPCIKNMFDFQIYTDILKDVLMCETLIKN